MTETFIKLKKKQHGQDRAMGSFQQLSQQLLHVDKKQMILRQLILKLSGISTLSEDSVTVIW